MIRNALFVAFVIAAGCGGARTSETLGETLRSFNDGVRWERFGVAAIRVPVADRSQWVAEMDERAEDVKVTDYEIVTVDSKTERAAQVQVKWSWYRISEGTLRETHALQTWERAGKTWLLVDTAHLRGAAMPGIPDRAADAMAPTEPPLDAALGAAQAPTDAPLTR